MPNHVIHSRFKDLPKESIANGALVRTALRGDNSMVVINWLHPTSEPSPPPHTHPFDQISLVLTGTLDFEVDGDHVLVGPGESLQIPADIPHTATVVGHEVVLNIDVYAPARPDYAHLTAHQDEAFNL